LAGDISGTVTDYNIEQTADDLENSSITPIWFSVASGDALSADALILGEIPVRAVRVTIVTGTGTVRLVVIQGRST